MKGCIETKRNAHAHDFHCNLAAGHTESHRDPRTGVRWRHPSTPYGMRKPRKQNGARKQTTPKTWWSAKPVVGYTPGPIARREGVAA